ncbi:MAG: RsmB/NOP family class I SAM-dependent RNA methyltransferase [Thalassobaculales bacterium]
MTPAGRLSAAIELIDLQGGAPMDAVLAEYFRARRYIGAKDRQAIAEMVYGVFRNWARLHWWLARLRVPADPRVLVLADRLQAGEDPRPHLGAGPYAPRPASPAEQRLLERLPRRGLDHPEMPAAVRLECPDWAYGELSTVLDEAGIAGLNRPAGLDLRVNALKATREAVAAMLPFPTRPTPFSPLGLRAEGRPPVAATPVYRDGLVEVQDEASQIAALLLDAAPGHQVIDFCAGVGGKTLAIAAGMANRGRVVACDIHGYRLDRAGQRLRRAGIHNVERRVLDGDGDKWVKRHRGSFDRVLVDAPCTGTGTWRRNPDARWSRSTPDLAELTALQAAILERACRLVRPGGRLVYATCSLLPSEDERQIERLLSTHPEFTLVPVAEAWAGRLDGTCPADGPYLRLDPARHGTDGFFVAVLTRQAAPEPEVAT